ncbi:MAG: lysophospholipid acyltransferase family protein [Verrucomicrobiales bacterium]|nr:lysophospholipid acyltransferase family protein [Verrucomicrobiales bacterium]
MASSLKQIRYRIEWLAIKFLKATMPLLPRRGILYLANTLGYLAYWADSKGRHTAHANLDAALAQTHDQEQRTVIAKQAYKIFARTMLDQFWSSRLTAENYLDFVELEIEDPEAFELAKKTGAIWVTPHYGNFEWTSLIMGFQDCPFTVVAQDFKNPLLTDLFKANREVSGHQVISQRGAMLRLFKALKKGGHAAFLTDLTIAPGRSATIINCFGLKTCVTALHAGLQQRTQLPIIPGFAIPLDNGNYRIKALSPIQLDAQATEQEISQACWDAFEKYMIDNPAPWLWMYKHWRYRPAENADHYPPYSRRSSKFDKLEQRLAEENQQAK